jgi:quercetin dioxygenase-like cupin family protein
MARRRATIRNTCTGETVTWLETAADTGGKRLAFRLEVAPGGRLPVVHVHPDQSETFVLESGNLAVEVDGKTSTLARGEPFVIAPGAPHTWRNASATEPAVMSVTFQPALNTEIFLEQFFGLGSDGKTGPDGTPHFLQIMAWVNEYQLYLASPPIPIQKIMGWLLGSVARLLGYRKFYPRYSSG